MSNATGYRIEIDARDMANLKEKLALCPQATKRAMYTALNRTLSKSISFTTNAVKTEYPSVMRKDIKGIATIKKPSYSNLTASIDYTGKRLKASAFPHRISGTKNRSPVSLKIKGSYVKSGARPVVFGARYKAGVRGKEVYKREDKAAETMYTLSVPQMISNDNVWKQIHKETGDFFMKRLEHELDYRLGLIEKG